jgi:hypothetical protein
MQYQVTYQATYYVDAKDEDEALDLAIEQHSDGPDGCWEAIRDPYESPLSSLKDGTYGISVLERVPYLVEREEGFWVAYKAVESIAGVEDGTYLGVWTDPDDGKRYYDATVLIEKRDYALSLAKEWGQKAIWDNANKVAIPVTD